MAALGEYEIRPYTLAGRQGVGAILVIAQGWHRPSPLQLWAMLSAGTISLAWGARFATR